MAELAAVTPNAARKAATTAFADKPALPMAGLVSSTANAAAKNAPMASVRREALAPPTVKGVSKIPIVAR
jgi:hypothetical protein